jgi:osmotically-inducible protein OsmY
MKPDRFLVLFLAPQMVLASTAVGGQTQPMTDDAIHDYVAAKLAAAFPGGAGIVVDVKDGVVTLTGSLPTKKETAQAEKLTKKVHGVKAVVNNITIANP